MSRAKDRGCALVTGASRGIGAAVARGLASDGWPVAVNYRESKSAAEAVVEEIRDRGGTAVAIPADITESGAAERICAAAKDALKGPVLALVNNVGIAASAPLLLMDDEKWQTVIDTNLTATFRLTRAAMRTMLRKGSGRIVNVASVVPQRTSPGAANYAASKAALLGFTKTVAVEVAWRGITVNAILPGLIDTDSAAKMREQLLPLIPARRVGAPEEVASCVRFLVSEEAGYVTGAALSVDGGLSHVTGSALTVGEDIGF